MTPLNTDPYPVGNVPTRDKDTIAENLVTAAEAFLHKTDKIINSPEYKTMWTMGWAHAGQYTGENWVQEYEDLQEAIKEWREVNEYTKKM